MNLLRLAGLLFLTGCGFHPGSATDGGPVNGFMDAPSGSDASTIDGPCGLVGAVRDDFDDNLTGTQWALYTSTQTAETGGELVVTPVAITAIGPAKAVYAGYVSKHAVDLTDSALTIEVTGMVDASSTGAYAEFGAFNSGSAFALIIENHGNIAFEFNDGQQNATVTGSIPYVPASHRYWRIAHTSTTLSAEVSADNATWTTLATMPKPAWLSRVDVAAGGISTDPTAHGSIHYDNLNQQVTAVPWCHTGSLTDVFDRTSIGFDWTATYTRVQMMMQPPCVPSVNGIAMFNQSGIVTNRCELVTAQGFDLTHDSVMVYVPPIGTSQPGWNPLLRVVTDELHAFYLQFEQNATNQMCAQVDSGAEVCVPYDAGNDLYWRISEAAGVLTFATSVDAATWKTVATLPITFAVTAVEVEIGTVVTAPFAGPIDLAMSAYNTFTPL